jgi:hypothetical protein
MGSPEAAEAEIPVASVPIMFIPCLIPVNPVTGVNEPMVNSSLELIATVEIDVGSL